MFPFKTALLAGAVALVGFAGAAHAGYDTGTFAFTVSTGSTGGGFSATMNAHPFTANTVSTATFTYTGALAFDNETAQNNTSAGDRNDSFFSTAGNSAASNYGITNYVRTVTPTASGSPPVNFSTLSDFLNSSGSVAGYQYGSFYTIDLGILAAGTVLTFTHDDGATVYQKGLQVGTSTPGPTQKTTDTVELTSTADTTLYYSRQNGTPSILQVSVPEPVSMAVLGTGLIGLGVARRRRSTATAN